MTDLRHNVDGWQLVAYRWHHESGNGHFTYQRDHRIVEVIRYQPGRRLT